LRSARSSSFISDYDLLYSSSSESSFGLKPMLFRFLSFLISFYKANDFPYFHRIPVETAVVRTKKPKIAQIIKLPTLNEETFKFSLVGFTNSNSYSVISVYYS
jgi:hypothetical protein